MKYIKTLMLLVLLSACKKELNITTQKDSLSIDSTKITKKDISKIDYTEYGIDNKAKQTLNSWEAYNVILRAIDVLKNSDFTFFKSDDEVFNTTLKDLESTIPDAVNSEPIKARILILKTKLLKLRALIGLNTANKDEKITAIKELLQSFSYFTLQVNKKFEKEAQNIIKRDSI